MIGEKISEKSNARVSTAEKGGKGLRVLAWERRKDEILSRLFRPCF